MAVYAMVMKTYEAISMKNIRVWVLFLFIAIGIVAIRLSPQTQDGVQSFLSGYGLFAFVLMLILVSLTFRTFRGTAGKHRSDSEDTPWWY